jgi:hypothetical protein
VQQGDDVQSWQLPAWMLTERNQRGDIDPIAWVLKHFPELTQATPTQQTVRAKLEGLLELEVNEPRTNSDAVPEQPNDANDLRTESRTNGTTQPQTLSGSTSLLKRSPNGSEERPNERFLMPFRRDLRTVLPRTKS